MTMSGREFTVIDVNTGEYPDLEQIALHEEWADGLTHCDMEGFAIMEDGNLILMDECGKYVFCPAGRFEVKFTEGDPDRTYKEKYECCLKVVDRARVWFEQHPWKVNAKNPTNVSPFMIFFLDKLRKAIEIEGERLWIREKD